MEERTACRAGAAPKVQRPIFAVPLEIARARFADSRFPIPHSRLQTGFTLVELLVAVAVFAALAAAAWGGLDRLAQTRAALAAQQDRFAAVTRAVAALERDLRQAVARPVLGNAGETLPALSGRGDALELTRLGFANPRAEPRSHLERLGYALDRRDLRRARYAVLDRAPGSLPATTVLLEDAGELRLRYLGCDGSWRDAWPPAQALPCELGGVEPAGALPRAVEFRLAPAGLGEIRRVVELPAALPPRASERGGPP
ncbi:MAG: type II secretion system minor pseudopilin GspJ [Rhodanobacteraceae bacterium]|nr:type II secretion system minor pseudopilin GspJ [Rhodanobacteraceae bacterium]